VSDLVRRPGTSAVTLEYRLAPEDPYPAAVEDARAAYEGLLAQGVAPGQIALAGESAGGGLAVALLGPTGSRRASAVVCILAFALRESDPVRRDPRL
jgi:acetyl esterase/lipase